MVFGQPVRHRRRQQVELIAFSGEEVVGHEPNSPSHLVKWWVSHARYQGVDKSPRRFVRHAQVLAKIDVAALPTPEELTELTSTEVGSVT